MPFTEDELEEMRTFDAELGDDEDIELTAEEIAASKDRDLRILVSRYHDETLSTDDMDRSVGKARKYRERSYTADQQQKRREDNKRWRESHQEERKEYARRYYQKYKELYKERNRRWRRKNPDKVKAYREKYAQTTTDVPKDPAPDPITYNLPDEIRNAGDFKPVNINGRITPYMISENGVVVGRLGVLKDRINSRGFHYVVLGPDGMNRKSYLVHRLMGQAFIPNPDDYKYIRFRDGNKDHLTVSNLEWVRDKPVLDKRKLDRMMIHKVCGWIHQGCNLRTISCVTGIPYMYICKIAEGKEWTDISEQYEFPDEIQY